MQTLTTEQLHELRQLVDEVANAPTKAASKLPLQKLKFAASHLSDSIPPGARHKLGEVVSWASDAAGNGRNSAIAVRALSTAWYVFIGLVSD